MADKQFILQQYREAGQPKPNHRLQQGIQVAPNDPTQYGEFNPFMRMCAVHRKVVKVAPDLDSSKRIPRNSHN